MPLIGHCIATWYAVFRYLVKLTELETSLGAWRYSDPISHTIHVYIQVGFDRVKSHLVTSRLHYNNTFSSRTTSMKISMCISQSHQLYRYTFLEGSGKLAGTFLMRLNFHVLEYYAEFKGIKIVAGVCDLGNIYYAQLLV